MTYSQGWISESMISKEDLLKCKKENWGVCTYGLGYLGRRLYDEIPAFFDLSAEYYCDRDDSKVDTIMLPRKKGIHLSDLLISEKPFLVFILVDDPYDLEIQATLSVNALLHTITLREMVNMDIVISKFYGNQLFSKYVNLRDF